MHYYEFSLQVFSSDITSELRIATMFIILDI